MIDVVWKRDAHASDGFTAHDAENGGYVGRIYIQPGGLKAGRWAWFTGTASGSADTKQEAADEVRKHWQASCARRPEAQAELFPRHMRE